jgi:signal transduction histidine kinase
MVMFYSGLFLISWLMFDSQMDTAKNHSVDEHYLIASSFGKDLAAVSMRSGSLEEAIKPIFNFYAEHYKRRGVYLGITKAGNFLYNSAPALYGPLMQPEKPKGGVKTISVEKSGSGVFAIVNGRLPGAEGYGLLYVSNISENISGWRHAQKIMLWVGMLFSLTSSVFLNLSLNKAFKPLSMVSAASKKIAGGEYGNEINISGHDEISEMAESFNNMAAEIRKHIMQLGEMSEKKQNFVDNFSHEMRTPLTSIFGYAEYLQKTDASEEERYDYLGRIVKESKHLLDMAGRMLELAMLNSPQIEAEEIETAELFRAVKEFLTARLEEKKIGLIYEHKLSILYGDKTLLTSLLINLTDNAVKACRVGGHIIWRASPSEKGHVITVEDDGEGIAIEQLGRIKEPFYRINKTKKKESGGAGLGLAICEQICRCHNAELSFESSPGEGTKVAVTFTS